SVRSRTETLNTSSEFASPASSPFAIPSRPAASTAVAARYGLQEPSTVRSSIRPGAGLRNICVRLLYPSEVQTGDHVAPLEVEPSLRRLYELTVGAVRAL